MITKHFVIQISIKEITDATAPETDRYGKTIKEGNPRMHRDSVSLTTSEHTLPMAIRKTVDYLNTELRFVEPSNVNPAVAK